MAKYRLDSLRGLARQMEFTPQHTLGPQLAAAEVLLHELDPAKAYPFDFVIFRITGYRPRKVAADLLTGMALQHDLGLLIEQMSDSLDLSTANSAEPVLSIDDVTERFNVTSKTIQRWRRRGLPARRFVFNDGKRRVGFLLSSVERFFAAHRDQVERGANFSQLDDRERELILRSARRLAGLCGCCEGEISRRIGRKFGRSPMTILHTVRRHDQEHPEQAIFPSADAPIGSADRAKILQASESGMGLRAIARRFCRSRAAIYRVIMDERIERLTAREIKFIDDPLYHQPDAADAIGAIMQQEELTASRSREEQRVPRDLPPYLQDLYRTPLLSPARERALFLNFNFQKYRFVHSRRRLEPQFARSRDLDELEARLQRVNEAKNAIVQANLRLVVSVARKHLRPNLNLMELISDGNITLMRAVEGFDVHKGNRFSTYATFALMKGFARSVPQMLSRTRASTGGDALLPELADARLEQSADRIVHRDQVNQLLSRLDERERTVLMSHYGLTEDAQPATYEEVGQRLGLSKQRIRQIEQLAIAKLRARADQNR